MLSHVEGGRTQRVLVPQLYGLVDANSNTLSGGLLNSGTLAARENLTIIATDITNEESQNIEQVHWKPVNS